MAATCSRCSVILHSFPEPDGAKVGPERRRCITLTVGECTFVPSGPRCQAGRVAMLAAVPARGRASRFYGQPPTAAGSCAQSASEVTVSGAGRAPPPPTLPFPLMVTSPVAVRYVIWGTSSVPKIFVPEKLLSSTRTTPGRLVRSVTIWSSCDTVGAAGDVSTLGTIGGPLW